MCFPEFCELLKQIKPKEGIVVTLIYNQLSSRGLGLSCAGGEEFLGTKPSVCGIAHYPPVEADEVRIELN
jgi:hypothetical protein